jgi:hypothetical protein
VLSSMNRGQRVPVVRLGVDLSTVVSVLLLRSPSPKQGSPENEARR